MECNKSSKILYCSSMARTKEVNQLNFSKLKVTGRYRATPKSSTALEVSRALNPGIKVVAELFLSSESVSDSEPLSPSEVESIGFEISPL